MRERGRNERPAARRSNGASRWMLAASLVLQGCSSLSFPEEPVPAPAAGTTSPRVAVSEPVAGVADSWAALSRAGRDALRLGHLALAEESFVEALASTAERPAEDVRVQASLGNLLRLATLYQQAERFDDAGRVLAVVTQRARAGRPPELELFEPVVQSQARWLGAHARADEAIALYRVALALPDGSSPAAARSRIELRHRLGSALLRAGRPDEAASTLEEVRQEIEAREGASSLGVASVLVDLARARYELGDPEAAEAALTHALMIQDRAAPGSLPIAITRNALARLYLEQERVAEAIAMASEAILILDAQQAGGALRAASLDTLAAAELARGDLAAAEVHYRAAIQARDDEPDPTSQRELIGILERYAYLLREAGRDSEAQAIEARVAAESR